MYSKTGPTRKFNDRSSAASATIANYNSIGNNKQREGSKNLQYSFQQRAAMPEKYASSPPPQQEQQRISYDVRTEKQNGLSSTPSTVEDFNIEAVLQDGSMQEEQSRNQYPEIYERISNFGSVKITSPQPMVPDRRGLTRFESSPPPPRGAATSIASTNESKDLQLPPLETSAPKTGGSRNTKSVNGSATTKPRVSKFANAKNSPQRLHKGNEKQQQSPQKSSPSKNSKFVGARAASPKRVSRIPSPTIIINPDASRLLPRRSASPRRITSPEKKVSPRRFRLPANNSNNKNKTASPKAQRPVPKPVPARNTTSRFGTENREKSKMRLRKPAPATSISDKRAANKTHSTSPARTNSISPFRRFPPARPSNEKITNEKFNSDAHKVEDLSNSVMDSCSIAESSLVPDADKHQREISRTPVMQSRNLDGGDGIKTNVIQLSPHLSPQYKHGHRTNEIREQVDARTQSPFVIRQHASPNTHENYHLSADENDAKRLNVRPSSTPQPTQKIAINGPFFDPRTPTKDSQERSGFEGVHRFAPQGRRVSQAIDAACLHSGDLIMLRSSGMNTTLQKEKDEIIAKFDGPCLGKDVEMLRIVKVEGGSSSPLMDGDIVILVSLSTQRALGSRRRRKDVSGKDELAFFEVGDKEYSRWMVRLAASGISIVVGRAALTGEHQVYDSPSPIRSGNSITLLNCSNGGLLSIRDGVTVLLTDSYYPNRMPFSNNPSLLERMGSNDRLEPTISEMFQLLKLSIPPCPTWVTPRGMGERLFLTGSYLSEPFRHQKENIIVDRNLPLRGKENILVDEVIGSFLGLEGLYIKMKESEKRSTMNNLQAFQLFDGDGIIFDLSLRNLVEQILPLSTSYVCVRDFIGLHYPGYEYGRVMQAFCEGLDVFLQQFVSFVAQIEHKVRNPPSTGALTMKNIHFEITPLIHSMSILENTTKTVHDKKGGALINALRSLEKRVYMGDTVAKDLLGTLLDRASVPYAEMLSIWLQTGRLHDPYEEFMVKKTQNAKNGVELDGDTWAELFIFNEDHVICDIVRNEKIKNKILVTGKYWNAVQACIVDSMSSEVSKPRQLELKKLQFQSDLSAISAYINSMYESASNKLMHILRYQFHLRESLQIMKRYFLLDQGDFLVNFLEATAEELAKPFEEVSIGRVQHFLGYSIQFTESQRCFDNFQTSFGVGKRRQLSPTSLRCRLSEQSLVSYLDSLYGGIDDLRPNTPSRQKYGSQKQGTAGFDFFEIDFCRVPFPISLIISPTSMENYKLLFRHLFFAKHVERRLVGVWSDHQVLKKLDLLRGLLGPTFLLRQRMQHCVQNLMNYMSFEVVESNWLEMLSSIAVPEDAMSNQKQQTVDDLLNIHNGLLQKTMDSCLLTNPPLIKSLIKLLNTCLLFTDQMKRFMDTTKIVSAKLLN